MKRKFWGILLSLISALCLCFGLAACDSNEGTYYLFENDEYRKETYFVLKGGNGQMRTAYRAIMRSTAKKSLSLSTSSGSAWNLQMGQ